MSSYRYKKAPAWVGKDLVIYIGGADRRIQDTEILIGPHFGKFVGMGFLVEAKDDAAPPKPVQPAAAPVYASVPVKAAPKALEEEAPDSEKPKDPPAMTRSSAAKLAATGVQGGGAKGKGKGKNKPAEAKEEEKPEPTKEEEVSDSIGDVSSDPITPPTGDDSSSEETSTSTASADGAGESTDKPSEGDKTE